MMLQLRGKEFRWGERTYVMGVLNLTPDSFSGDGLYFDPERAVDRAQQIEAEGADILDIGGESTRPAAEPVSTEEELRRVIPILERIVPRVSLPISIDTYKYEVARAALDVGAQIINDVWGLKRDPRLAELAAQRGAPLIIVHNQWGAKYQNLIDDIIMSLRRSLDLALCSGVPRSHIIIDPGIGFGKTLQQNIEVLSQLEHFTHLGFPILVGTSRKLTPNEAAKDIPPDRRLEETAATVALSIAKGADIVRVHDIAFMVRVCRMADAVVRRSSTSD